MHARALACCFSDMDIKMDNFFLFKVDVDLCQCRFRHPYLLIWALMSLSESLG